MLSSTSVYHVRSVPIFLLLYLSRLRHSIALFTRGRATRGFSLPFLCLTASLRWDPVVEDFVALSSSVERVGAVSKVVRFHSVYRVRFRRILIDVCGEEGRCRGTGSI